MNKRHWIAIAALAAAVPATNAFAAPAAGDRSFTISGTGASDKNFDSTTFGTTGELGWFMTDALELGIRQSVNVLTIDHGDDSWSGATRGFADYHFGRDTIIPYVGANLGGLYGDGVHDTGAAGLETGVKFYVKDKTFVALQVEYDFLFNDTNDIDNRFDDGAFFYTLGVGFNF